MKRLLPLALFTVFAFTYAVAQPGPNLKFDKSTHDFAKIPQGKPVSYEFTFTNTGDEPLILQNVKASCGCTTPYYPTEAIKPGETSKIKAVYNASRPGAFTKSIAITTNMKKQDGTEGKRFTIYIKGEVVSGDLKEKSDAPQSPVKKTN